MMQKNKLRNYLKPKLLGFIIPVLLGSCQGESFDAIERQQNTIETVSTQEVVDFFSVKTASKSATSSKAAYVIPHLENSTQEEIINSDALLTVIPATTIYKGHYSRILLLKINNEIQGIVFSMHASEKASSAYFTGEILITTLQGDFLNGYRVANGQFIAQFKRKEENENMAAKNGNAVCPQHGECTAESDCILCLQELEEVEVVGASGDSGEVIDIYVGLNDFPDTDEGGNNGPDMGMEWDYSPGEGSNDDDESSCPDGYTKDSNGICVEDDKIINELTGKAKCVHDKMVDGNNNINWILKNFKDGNKPSEFDLRLTMSYSLDDNINASTVKSGNTFIIKINADRAENTNTTLTIARTIIHEGIHARLREFASRNGSNATSFPGVYDYFRAYGKNWDHQQMANHYRATIAQGLKQFDNAQHSDAFYEALAWEGLAGELIDANDASGNTTFITESWEVLSQEEQQEILDIIKNHKRNGSKSCQP